MSQVDLPSQKELLWHRMRSDLTSLMPYFRDKEVLLCPACCRPITFDDFSVEHVVPKQALALDPTDARNAVTQNTRSGLTLLCRKQLVINGKKIPGNGCNGWKGKHFDASLRKLIGSKIQSITTRDQVALFIAGYLALVREYGYQIVLSEAGRLCRAQFFHPNDFRMEIPWNCQIILGGAPRADFTDDAKSYWSEPFKITIDGPTALIILRHMGFRVPISRDPSTPIARVLPYAPLRFTFRPDGRTFFD